MVEHLGLHNQIDNLYRIKFPETSDKFMIFATIPRHVVLPEFVISQVSKIWELIKQKCFNMSIFSSGSRILIYPTQLLRELRLSSILLPRSMTLRRISRRSDTNPSLLVWSSSMSRSLSLTSLMIIRTWSSGKDVFTLIQWLNVCVNNLRLLLDTFDKFMRRDVHIRYKYLTRMASIIYQVTKTTLFRIVL